MWSGHSVLVGKQKIDWQEVAFDGGDSEEFRSSDLSDRDGDRENEG
jgi:hypothetical protein